MTAQTQPLTVAEVMKAPPRGRWELIEGGLITMAPTSAGHGRFSNRVAYLLTGHVEKAGIGVVYAAETGFMLSHDPDTLRAPDVSFISAGRQPVDESGFIQGAPDLAAEIVSPHDRSREVNAKAQQWLDAGTRLVWVVWPETRSVTVHRPGRDERLLHDNDTLDGEDVVPGFACRVSEIFK